MHTNRYNTHLHPLVANVRITICSQYLNIKLIYTNYIFNNNFGQENLEVSANLFTS